MPGDPLTRFFFPDWPAERLGVLRWALGLYVLQDLIRMRRAVLALAPGDPTLWEPVGVTTLLPGPLSANTWHLVHDSTILVGVLWTLGLFWRAVGPAFAAGLLFVWTYRVSWQMVYHVHHLPMLHVLVLSVGPSAAALSVDARFGERWAALRWNSADTGWVVRLVCVVTTLVYALAGIAKLQMAGWGWMDGHNLVDQISYDAIYKAVLAPPRDQPSPLVSWAWNHPQLMALFATSALFLELGAPLVLVNRHLARAWALGAIGMHWGIHAFMNLVFPYPISGVAFLSFFPLERLIPPRFRRGA